MRCTHLTGRGISLKHSRLQEDGRVLTGTTTHVQRSIVPFRTVNDVLPSARLLRAQSSGLKAAQGPHALAIAPTRMLPPGPLTQPLPGHLGPPQLSQQQEVDLPRGRAFRPAPKLRVAVDVDEVLGVFLKTLILFCEEEYGISHELEEFYVYDFKKIWKCSQDEANHRVHKFFTSKLFTNGLPIIPGAFESLTGLAPYCDFSVVTSRQHIIQHATLQWLNRHYPGLFSEVYFGNHFALEGKSKSKSEICRDIGATMLIDDNPGYAVECASQGIHVLLFDWELRYAWSKTEEGPSHPLIRRVKDWEEVQQQLMLHVQV